MATLELDGIGRRFGDTTAVDNISLSTARNEFLVLLGPSGCGKTTLLRMIAGLLPPSEGRILVDGRDVTVLPPRERDLAMVFQNYALYPHLTVERNLGFGLSVRKIGKEEIRRRVDEVSEFLDLDGLLKRRPKELSGGQRQRVALGRAMVREPMAFLMDEPLSNLDAQLRSSTRTRLTALHRRLDTTFVYVTHDQVDAMTMATKVAVLNKGRVEQFGTPVEIYDKPASAFVAGFMGAPPMNLLPAELGTGVDDSLVLRGPSPPDRETDPFRRHRTLGDTPMASLLFRQARVFDGESVHTDYDVLVVDGKIAQLGSAIEAPADAEIIEAHGKTLLPGLIDSHTHAKPPALEMALTFGVTTELDMFSDPEGMGAQRREAQTRNSMADVRSAMTGASAAGGHPSGMVGLVFDKQYPVLEKAGEAEAFVAARVAEGADYFKLFVDDGTVFGVPSPTLSDDVIQALTKASHEQGLMVVAHAMSVDCAFVAIRAGVDGLVHVPADRLCTDEEVAEMVASGIFVVPTLSTMSALHGDKHGQHLAEDDRARSKMSEDWAENLCQCWDFPAPGATANAIDITRRLYDAGVDVLAGTDAVTVGVPGTAHGVSMHGELELLVDCGLTPAAALRAATLLPAKRFGLDDRGRIAPGLQADLVLVDGDPTTDVRQTLSIEGVWRRGEQAPRIGQAEGVGTASAASAVAG